MENAAETPTQLQGTVSVYPASGMRRALLVATGVAAVRWVIRCVAWALRLETSAHVVLTDEQLRVLRRTQWLGRVVRERNEIYARSAIVGAAREVRQRVMHTLLGLSALSFSVGVGSAWVSDGIVAGLPSLVLLAAGIIFAGALLDLGFEIAGPAARARTFLRVWLTDIPAIQLRDVDTSAADAFIAALERKPSPQASPTER